MLMIEAQAEYVTGLIAVMVARFEAPIARSNSLMSGGGGVGLFRVACSVPNSGALFAMRLMVVNVASRFVVGDVG